MSESTTMSHYEQFTPSSREPLVFDTINKEIPTDAVKGGDDLDTPDLHAAVAEAEALVRNVYKQTANDRLVFPDEKRGHFEIANPEKRHNMMAEPSMIDDAWREQVETRRRAAAEEAEAHAAELEQATAVGANAQAINATRDYVLQYGVNAEAQGAALKKPSFFGKVKKLVTGSEPQPKVAVSRFRKLTQRELIHTESKVGSTVFGEIPASHRREFFTIDPNTWVWYEKWPDEATGQDCEMTTRYEIHPHGVLKVQDGQPYTVVEGEELLNLAIATRMARERVMREVYNRDPVTGELLSATAATI